MLRELSFTIEGLATDYDSIEERYFNAFKEVHSNTNITIEEWRGSNIYNIFNTCILVEMVNNQFLSNFIPNIADNSIEQNEIIEQKYSGNTTFYLIQQLKKLDNIKDVQIIDVNSDSVGTSKGNARIFIKREHEEEELEEQEVGMIIYNNLGEGIITLGEKQIIIDRDGFTKKIKYSYSKNVECSLQVEASPNSSWNGDLYSIDQLISLIHIEWIKYYEMQKKIQPQVFLRELIMLANVSFKFIYNGTHMNDFLAVNGEFLVLDKENIELKVG